MYAYINNGKGKFKTKYLTRDRDHSLNVLKLWDVDNDGYLDLLTNSKHKIQVFGATVHLIILRANQPKLRLLLAGKRHRDRFYIW